MHKGSQRIVARVKDLFRRRLTEELRFVRFPSKGFIVIGPVKQTPGKGFSLEAPFVSPRFFTQLNPFGDHHTALALELGAYQLVRAGLAKFENRTEVSMPVISTRIRWVDFPSSDKTVLLTSERTAKKTIHGRELQFFDVRIVDAENPENAFASGELVIGLLKKGEPRGKAQPVK